MDAIAEGFNWAHITLGRHIEDHLLRASPYRKYALEIAVRLPMLFFIHQWLLLAPYSDYTIFDIPLLWIRFMGCSHLFSSLEMSKTNLMFTYSALAIDTLVAWKVESSYWLVEKVFTDNCTNSSCTNLENTERFGWTIGDTILIQTFYLLYLNLRYGRATALTISGILMHFSCCFVYMKLSLVPMFYYFYKFVFVIAVLVQINFRLQQDTRMEWILMLQRLGVRTILPGKWIWRDLCTTFAIIYFSVCLMIDLARVGISEVFTSQFCKSFIGTWTTSLVILICLAAVLGTCSNIAVALSRFIVLGNTNFREAFDAHVGGIVDVGMIIISLQAGMLSTSHFEGTRNMPIVLLLITFAILSQLWNIAEDRLLFLFNRGETTVRSAYARVGLFWVAVIGGPTYFNYYLASSYQFDLWSLLNMTGVFLLLSRTLVSLVECTFLSVSWCFEDGAERFAGAIYYIRVGKSIISVICSILMSYYRFSSPYLNGPFLLRLTVALSDCLFVTLTITKAEMDRYAERRRLIARMNFIADATVDQIKQYDDVCAVCHERMNSGKRLTCGHIYHSNCLSRWFQVKTTCPLCNKHIEIHDALDLV